MENHVSSKSFETVLARIISNLFHPLLMPTYGFALIFFTRNYFSTFIPLHFKYIILSITFIFTFLLPAINALILLKMGRIRSLEMSTSRERIIPYISTILYYFAIIYLFYNAEFPMVFTIFILGAAISILITLLINFRWKISAHTVGIGGVVGASLGIIYRLQIDLQFAFLTMLLLAGVIGYARLKLKSHSPSQVYAGFALGFFIELFLVLFY